MAAFVAGATGYVGREVVRALVGMGEDVVAHVRPDSPRLAEWRQRFEAQGAMVDTTAWESAAMVERMAELQPSVVFALLGTTKKRAKADGLSDGYEAVDVGLTVMLLDAVARSQASARFVYLSSTGVSASSKGAYLRARAKTERAVIDSGVAYTIARPSIITGPGRDDGRASERAAAVVGDGLLAVVGALGGRRLRDRYRSTTNAKLARSLVRLAYDGTAANRIIESEGLRDG